MKFHEIYEKVLNVFCLLLIVLQCTCGIVLTVQTDFPLLLIGLSSLQCLKALLLDDLSCWSIWTHLLLSKLEARLARANFWVKFLWRCIGFAMRSLFERPSC
jgi:hypothetical protein